MSSCLNCEEGKLDETYNRCDRCKMKLCSKCEECMCCDEEPYICEYCIEDCCRICHTYLRDEDGRHGLCEDCLERAAEEYIYIKVIKRESSDGVVFKL